MSLWWPKRIRVRLTPFEVSVADNKSIERFAVEGGEDVVEWRHALGLLAEKLKQPRYAGRLALDVELSNHFVSYLVIPQRKELRGRAELEAFARHRFVHTYGAIAQDWTLCLSGDAGARVAGAIDSKLVRELQLLCKRGKYKLNSVVPALSAGFDQARISREHERYWYVQRERARVCVGCVELGKWALVYGQGLLTGDANELGAIFQQLSMTSPGWIPNLPIYTQGIDARTLAALTEQGWKMRQAGPLKVTEVKARNAAAPPKSRSAESST